MVLMAVAMGMFIVAVWKMALLCRRGPDRISAARAARRLTLRIPRQIYDELGARAALEDRTMDEQVIHILRAWYLGEQVQEKTTTPLASGATTCSDEEA
jgi:hypothetical protein